MTLNELTMNMPVEVKIFEPGKGWVWVRAVVVDPTGTPPILDLETGLQIEAKIGRIRRRKVGK